MFFKRKCPHCGAKNPKERMTCAECGAPLALGQVEGRPARSRSQQKQATEERGQQLFVFKVGLTRKIVADRVTETVVMEDRFPFIFFPRQRIIPFSAVVDVFLDRHKRKDEYGNTVHVSEVGLHVRGEKYGNERVPIAEATDNVYIYNLASRISTSVGKKLIVASDKPESDMFPTKTFDGDKLPRDWKL